MSDAEDDWPSSDEDAGAGETKNVVAPAVVTHRSDASKDPSKIVAPVAMVAAAPTPMLPYEPQIVFYKPTMLFLNNPTQGLVAGATIIHNAIKRQFSFFFYDQTQRPLIFEAISFSATEDNDAENVTHCLPLHAHLEANNMMRLEDSQKRTWKAQFRDRKDCVSFFVYSSLLVPLVATCLCGSKPLGKVVLQQDIVKGKRGTAKVGTYAHLLAKVFVYPIPPEFCDVRAATLGESRQMAQFKANLLDIDDSDTSLWAHLRDVSVKVAPESDFPSSLGQAICGMKTDSVRVFAFSSDSGMMSALRSIPGIAGISDADRPSAIVLAIKVANVSKKSKRSKQKDSVASPERSEVVGVDGTAERRTAIPRPDVNASTASVPTVALNGDAEDAADSSEVARPALHSDTQTMDMSQISTEKFESTFSRALAASVVMQTQVQNMPKTQLAIIKRILRSVYSRMTQTLNLPPATPGDDEPASTVVSSQVTSVLQETCQTAVEEASAFQDQQSTPGTVAAITAAFSSLEPLLRELGSEAAEVISKQHGVLDALSRQTVRATADVPSSRTHAEIAALRAANARLEDEKKALSKQQMSLASANIDMEEEVLKLKRQNQELQDKNAALTVFEQAVGSMRALYDDELQARQKVQEDYAHLLTLQQKLKLTWVPDSASDTCLACGDRFKSLGSKSKHHCRYCGRLFCGDCTNYLMALPELGYPDKVRVCKSCCVVKSGNGPQSIASRSTAAAPDDRDELISTPAPTSKRVPAREPKPATKDIRPPPDVKVYETANVTDKLGVPAALSARQTDLPDAASHRAMIRARKAAAVNDGSVPPPSAAIRKLGAAPASLAAPSVATPSVLPELGKGSGSRGLLSEPAAPAPAASSLLGGRLGATTPTSIASASATKRQEDFGDDDYDY